MGTTCSTTCALNNSDYKRIGKWLRPLEDGCSLHGATSITVTWGIQQSIATEFHFDCDTYFWNALPKTIVLLQWQLDYRRSIMAEVRPCGICGWQVGTATVFSPVYIIPPLLHNPYSFIPNMNLVIEGVANNTFLLPYLACSKPKIGS
jgi:hypothetical protein